MKPYLLDINVLVALAWPSHVHHAEAQQWFACKREVGFRTCPLTEVGFVRISSNPSFTPNAVLPSEAALLLERITAMPQHKFWPDDLSLLTAIGVKTLLVGHRQITDAYLVALAKKHGGILATFDRGALTLPNAVDGAVELVAIR